jgi:hypothetical protein
MGRDTPLALCTLLLAAHLFVLRIPAEPVTIDYDSKVVELYFE